MAAAAPAETAHPSWTDMPLISLDLDDVVVVVWAVVVDVRWVVKDAEVLIETEVVG